MENPVDIFSRFSGKHAESVCKQLVNTYKASLSFVFVTRFFARKTTRFVYPVKTIQPLSRLGFRLHVPSAYAVVLPEKYGVKRDYGEAVFPAVTPEKHLWKTLQFLVGADRIFPRSGDLHPFGLPQAQGPLRQI
jgi:hypothetical protein